MAAMIVWVLEVAARVPGFGEASAGEVAGWLPPAEMA
jgi:hypothetical protein